MKNPKDTVIVNLGHSIILSLSLPLSLSLSLSLFRCISALSFLPARSPEEPCFRVKNCNTELQLPGKLWDAGIPPSVTSAS